MPTCQECGAYFSEGTCPFCTPEDSPASPVTTTIVEERKTVLIMDPLELLESIEKVEIQLKNLEEEKDREIQRLTEEVATQEDRENELTSELEGINSQVSDLEGSLKEQQEKRHEVIQGKEKADQEIETLTTKVAKLEENVSTRAVEIAKLKTELGAL